MMQKVEIPLGKVFTVTMLATSMIKGIFITEDGSKIKITLLYFEKRYRQELRNKDLGPQNRKFILLKLGEEQPENTQLITWPKLKTHNLYQFLNEEGASP